MALDFEKARTNYVLNNCQNIEELRKLALIYADKSHELMKDKRKSMLADMRMVQKANPYLQKTDSTVCDLLSLE